MDKRFSGDSTLAHILKWYGWGLYDVTTVMPRVTSFSWKEIAGPGAAEHYHLYHRYYLLPLPEEGESVKMAYINSRNERTYPILRIPKIKPKEERHFMINAEDGFNGGNFDCYFLNELYFQEKNLSASSSIFFSDEYPSRVSIPAKQAVDVFSHYFALVTIVTDGGVLYQEPLNKFID